MLREDRYQDLLIYKSQTTQWKKFHESFLQGYLTQSCTKPAAVGATILSLALQCFPQPKTNQVSSEFKANNSKAQSPEICT